MTEYETPPIEQVQQITQKLEEYLSMQGWQIELSLYDPPLQSAESIDNGPWIDHVDYFKEVIVRSNDGTEIAKFPACVVGFDFFHNIQSDRTLWTIAWGIQNRVYSRLNKIPSHLHDKNEPYWGLWTHIKN